jgi:hypothetical protein
MMRGFGSICLGLSLLVLSAPAWGWTLEGPQARWDIDEKTGAIRSATTADGFKAIGRSKDVYEVVYADHVDVADESGCTVISADADALPTKLTVKCEHAELGLTVTKRYRIDERTGWLMKETSIVAPELDKGFVHLLSNVRITSTMWRDSYLYHPIWNSGGNQFVKSAEVTEPRHFRAADGTGLMTLSNPGRNLTIGHVRYAACGEPVFFDHAIGIRGIGNDITPEIETRQTDTIAKPGQWTMSSMHGAVGNGVREPVSVEMGYALMGGDLYDFHLAYVALPEIYDILHYERLSAPTWVRDHLIDVWTSYTVDNARTGRAFKRLLDRMWFGWISMPVFGYYEDTYSYPGDDEQWATHLTTVRDREDLYKTFERRGKSPDDYIVRRGDGEVVKRSGWKPSEQRAAVRAILAAADNAPRLRPAIYTHMGTSGQDRESPLARNHPELIIRRANGKPYRHRTDYNMTDAHPVGVLLQGADPIMQAGWVETLERQLDFNGLDFTYFDTLARSAVKVDWKHHRAVQSQEMYAMYKRFVDECHERDAALFTNYAAPMFNDMSYSEQAAYSSYKRNWRSYVGRMMGQQALNRRGRPLIIVGTPESFPRPYPPETLDNECVPFVVHSPLMHNVRMSLHPATQNDPDLQNRFANRIMPWLQAFFELRLRAFVNPHVQPRWWAHETELESQPYNLDKASGIISFMNHTDEAMSQKVTFETAPLGLQPGKPAWVWRLQMPHPHQIEDALPADDAPIRRLAKQTLVRFHDKLPETLSYEEAWPADTPVLLLITHSPGLVSTVDGKTCQWFLPEAYRTRIQIDSAIDLESGRVDLTVTTHDHPAEVLVPGAPGKLLRSAKMLRVSGMHEAGVLPAIEDAESSVVEIDGQRFLKLRVPKGVAEFTVQ